MELAIRRPVPVTDTYMGANKALESLDLMNRLLATKRSALLGRGRTLFVVNVEDRNPKQRD